MLPLSLLFSSDEQASHSLSQALTELEFAVECCPDIFGAVEKITSRSFDIIVSDWNEGLEAAFLLKTSRELKANHAAFTIAIADADAADAAREAGADLVLSRPLLPEGVKYALLTCDPFLAHMKTWLPKFGIPVAENNVAENHVAENHVSENQVSENRAQKSVVSNIDATWSPLPEPFHPVPEPTRALRAWPSPPPPQKYASVTPVVAAESIFDEDLLYRSRVQTLFQREPSFSSASTFRRKEPSRLLPSIAIAVAFLTVGYVFSEPLYSKGAATSVAQICGRALDRTQSWLHSSNQDSSASAAVEMAEDESPQPANSHHGASRIRVTPVRDPFLSGAVGPPAKSQAQRVEPETIDAQSPSRQQAPAAAALHVPESLKTPTQGATMRTVAARITPSLLAALEPVELSEDLSRRLLMQKILPNYPEKAIREKLQGPVVLQAFIARDGTIQDLKLIRGSLLLGQAAYNAVRQWRYQPYLINGRAVEAQTLVTVDFKLP